MRFLSVIGCLLLVACSSHKKSLLESEKSVDEMFKGASLSLKSGEYTEAANAFKDIDTSFPYSDKAARCKILSAYSYFLAKNYMEALRELELFLKYHPADPAVGYALYLKAMCSYVQVVSVGRDIEVAREAKDAFLLLVNSYPNSKYTKDALKKIRNLDNLCAAHHMSIASFYAQRGNHLAAVGRYNYVLGNYGDTDYVEEAYYRIIESCQTLNLREEAQSAYKAMKKIFSEGKWLKKADLIMEKK